MWSLMTTLYVYAQWNNYLLKELLENQSKIIDESVYAMKECGENLSSSTEILNSYKKVFDEIGMSK